MIVLDTSLLSNVFRRSSVAKPHKAVHVFRQLVEDDEPLALPGVVFQELLSGVKTPQTFQRLEDVLSGFPLLLADRATHLRAADVRNRCRSGGISAASFDCLIAAHTLVANAELFTLDEDFKHISKRTGLRLLKW